MDNKESKRTQLVKLYRQAEDYFFRSISLKCLTLSDAANAYMTGVPTADLNFVYIKKNINTLDKILSQSKQFYLQNNVDFIVIIPEEFCRPETNNIFKVSGYSQTGKCTAMFLNLKDLTINHAARFNDGTIIRENDDQLNDWMAPLIAFPETDPSQCIQYADTHKLAQRKKSQFYHFSLYKGIKPIASITLSIHDTIARIDDLGTLPEFQGQGYATRLMIYALSKSKKLAARHCFLEASDSGFQIYQKLGFYPLFINNVYSRTA